MPILNFQKCYAAAVENGSKSSTIRRKRKIPIKARDTLHLYTGLRTRYSRRLGIATCLSVKPIAIHQTGDIRINGVLLDPADESDLIRADGFSGKADFMDYFGRDGFPFEGDLISWGRLHERSDAT